MKTKTLVMLLAAGVAIVSLSAPSDARRNNAEDSGDSRTTRPSKRRRKPTTRKKTRLWGMHAQMVKVCGLNEKQQLRIVELNALRREAGKKYRAQNAEIIKTLRAKIAEANRNKDKQAKKDAHTQIRSFRFKQREIDVHWQKQIMAVLTPEQKVQWSRYQTMLSVMRRFGNVKLTDAQKTKIKAACAKFTKGVNMSDKKARRKTMKILAEYIRKEILTHDQYKATTRPTGKPTTRPSDSGKSTKVKKPA